MGDTKQTIPMLERTVYFDCVKHDLHKKALIRVPLEDRQLLNPKHNGVFCISSSISGWGEEMRDKYGCEDFKQILSDITEVEHIK